jgi:hypothetical protein
LEDSILGGSNQVNQEKYDQDDDNIGGGKGCYNGRFIN